MLLSCNVSDVLSCFTGSVGDTFCETAFNETNIRCSPQGKCVCNEGYGPTDDKMSCKKFTVVTDHAMRVYAASASATDAGYGYAGIADAYVRAAYQANAAARSTQLTAMAANIDAMEAAAIVMAGDIEADLADRADGYAVWLAQQAGIAAARDRITALNQLRDAAAAMSAGWGDGAAGWSNGDAGWGDGASGWGRWATGWGNGASGWGNGAGSWGNGAAGYGNGAGRWGNGFAGWGNSGLFGMIRAMTDMFAAQDRAAAAMVYLMGIYAVGPGAQAFNDFVKAQEAQAQAVLGVLDDALGLGAFASVTAVNDFVAALDAAVAGAPG